MTPRQRRILRRVLKPLPRRSNIRRFRVLRFAAPALRRSEWLFSYRRGPVLSALYSGSIVTMLPLMGVQLIVALGFCLVFRGNLTIAAALQLVSNPLTALPLYGSSYATGAFLLEQVGIAASASGVDDALLALCVGGVIFGLVLAASLHVALVLLLRPAGTR